MPSRPIAPRNGRISCTVSAESSRDSNVISTLCLVLLLGGGTAYAAKSLLPKNSVGPTRSRRGAITPAKLSSSAKSTLIGPAGPKGAAGPQGSRGPRGRQVPAANLGPLLTVLPSGKSETGIFNVGGHRPGRVPRLSARSPIRCHLPRNQKCTRGPRPRNPSPECPGTATEPKAAPGSLCIYLQRQDVELNVFAVGPGFKAGFGYGLLLNTDENGSDQGSWAVTAP